MVDVLVLNYNDCKATIKFVSQFRDYKNIRNIMIVDNCSTDNSLDELKNKCPSNCLVIKTDHNGGYGYGNNIGVKELISKKSSKHILIANPDTFIEESAIDVLKCFLDSNKEYSVVSPLMKNINGEPSLNTSWRRPTKNEYIKSFGKTVMINLKVCSQLYLSNKHHFCFFMI